MHKLYRKTDNAFEYWETWQEDVAAHTIHWGALGTKGQSRVVKSSFFRNAGVAVQKEMKSRIADGYRVIEVAEHKTLQIEYVIDGMGKGADISKRHALEARLDELLGWTGLGNCDGGDIGSGAMEVFCFVVDFELAKKVVEKDLAGSEFADYSRIYSRAE